eukprot:TRINITY_DN7228_c0_g1_i2.p1 TRINITY_DN7228_c0_g1~~TRINITY_DN7228_c0_g1_i2.p1  ORF type:complete len:233 (-),score=47.46 TRINITY_DN7228_c0_g1_i2:93-791(-)
MCIRDRSFYHKTDKKGNPCLVIRVCMHYSKTATADQETRFAIHMLEKGINESDKIGSGRITLMIDLGGFTMKNADKRLINIGKTIISTLQDCYPERLERVLVLKANWFYKSVYQVVKLFLHERTRGKIKILNDYKELLEYFEPDCILKEHGGTSEFNIQMQRQVSQSTDDTNGQTEEEMIAEMEKELAKENEMGPKSPTLTSQLSFSLYSYAIASLFFFYYFAVMSSLLRFL